MILQQDKVTCVNTLWRAATGALHLTNYRIIFTGEFMQVWDIIIIHLFAVFLLSFQRIFLRKLKFQRIFSPVRNNKRELEILACFVPTAMKMMYFTHIYFHFSVKVGL